MDWRGTSPTYEVGAWDAVALVCLVLVVAGCLDGSW